jgi:hypothetical protein
VGVMSSRIMSFVLLVVMLVAVRPVDVAAQEAVPYVGPEGNVLAMLTVDQITDPFREYSPDSPPNRGFHFVLAHLTVENAGSQPLSFEASRVYLLDGDGFLYPSASITRTEESRQIAPDFPYSPIAPGEAVQGALTYAVPNGVQLARVVYMPGSNRLLLLADLGSAASALQPPPQTQTATAPTAPTSTASLGAFYESSDFGFQLAYDPTVWQLDSETSSGVNLSDGRSYVSISGSLALPSDAGQCLDASVESLSVTSSRQDYAQAVSTNGNPIGARGPGAAFAVYTYLDRNGRQHFERVECRTLPENRGVVSIIHNGLVNDYETETAAFETLVTALDLG